MPLGSPGSLPVSSFLLSARARSRERAFAARVGSKGAMIGGRNGVLPVDMEVVVC